MKEKEFLSFFWIKSYRGRIFLLSRKIFIPVYDRVYVTLSSGLYARLTDSICSSKMQI